MAKKILVVEDDVNIADLLRLYLEKEGYEADDIIGTTVSMAREAGLPSLVITGDRDALQLAGDGCTVIINKKGILAALQDAAAQGHLQF